MKVKQTASAALLSFLVSLGTVFCISTAFRIPAEPVGLVLACFGFSLLFPVLFSVGKDWPAFLILILGLALWLYLDAERLRDAFRLALECIMDKYEQGFPALGGTAPDYDLPRGTKAGAALAVLAALQAFFTAWTVMGAYSLLPLALLNLPCLLLCLMIVDVFPATWALLVLLGAYTLLILSQGLRRERDEEGGRLCLMLALPVAALLIALALVVRPGEYQRPDWPNELRESIDGALDSMVLKVEEAAAPELQEGEYGALGSYVWNNDIRQADMAQAGRRRYSGRKVMEIYTETAGVYYLRGYSLAEYEDSCWTALDEEEYSGDWNEGRYVVYDPHTGVSRSGEGSPPLWLSSGAESGEISLKTAKSGGIYYIPYLPTSLPEGAVTESDAYVGNPEGEKEYRLPYAQEISTAPGSSGYADFVAEHYTAVPEETRETLEPIIHSLSDAGAKDLPQAVCDYVKESADYSLATDRMPEGEDFVSWFLTESDTGYCIHFASSAAMLLRCAGVPSRYVSGYMVEAQAGEWTEVTQDDAHAWVEYFVPGLGWVMMEATPAALAQPRPEESQEPEEPSPTPETPENEPAPEEDKDSGGEEDKGGAGRAKSAWLLLLIPAALPPLYLLRRNFTRNKLAQGDNTLRAVRRCRRILALWERCGAQAPEEAMALGEKARFSRHSISDGELERLTELEREAAEKLKSRRPAAWLIWFLTRGE